MRRPGVGLSPHVAALVRAEIARAGTQAAVARRIGVAKATLSSALNGSYPAHSIAPLEARIRAALDRVDCPHLERSIGPDECRRHRERPMPTNSRGALRHWAACQRCSHNPNRTEES